MSIFTICVCYKAYLLRHMFFKNIYYCLFLYRKHGKEIPKLNNDIAAYYQLMKSNWKDHFGTTTANGIQERKVTVYGLGTSISAAFLAMFQYMAFLSMLLLGDGLCPSVALIGIMVPLYLYLTSYQRLSKAVSLQELMHVPWSCVIGK